MTESLLYTTALDPETRAPTTPPLATSIAHQRLLNGLIPQIDVLRRLRGKVTRGERRRPPPVDLGDPRAAGWTFVVGADDPERDRTTRLLQRLAAHRGMPEPGRPLVYGGQAPWDWISEVYRAKQRVPHYVLIASAPAYVPFGLQSLLGTVAAVGRVAFPEGDGLETYVNKILRLEQAAAPVTAAEALIFAPNAGPGDATGFSEPFMAKPLADHLSKGNDVSVRYMRADEATKVALLEACANGRPALVYTASHGLGPPKAGMAGRELTGAICCQPAPDEPLAASIVAASDIPDQPFAEGAVVFQFACFGAGVPALSESRSWLTGQPERWAENDFVAALPQRLLGHPRGPIGFVGHVDEAYVEGFADPRDPEADEIWSSRLRPFVDAVDELVRTQPAGLSLAGLARQYNLGNARLADAAFKARAGLSDASDSQRQLVSTFICRTDAKNYLVLGDPAARLRMPSRDD